jgi:RNA ligase
LSEFQEFPKMARWTREIIITEKIDGTNGAVLIEATEGHESSAALWQRDGISVYAQSRSRLITPAEDNFGFARWVQENAEELASGLGVGRHFGEWWGAGIQRRYGLAEKRFSLFNVSRWGDSPPALCHVVPLLYRGMMAPGLMESAVSALAISGSIAAPGFMDPEGVVLFHVAANVGFKKTIKKDDAPKSISA